MIRIFEALPSVYKPKEIEKINEVVIDNVNGYGATPLNQGINYLGFVAYIEPAKFLELALEGLRDLNRAANYNGEPIGAPFLKTRHKEERNTIEMPIDGILLQIHHEEDGSIIEVSNHEGRHRVSGIINSLGNDFQIPVHVKVAKKEARDLTSEEILDAEWISQNGRRVDMSDATFYLRGERIN